MQTVDTCRALVIAIERYPDMRQQIGVLAGTNENAKAFVTWLLKYKGAPPHNIYYCSSSGKRPAGVHKFDATRDGIKEAIFELVKNGREETEELYIYYSGHGFLLRLREKDPGKDVLVPANFRHPDFSLDVPIGLDELRSRLQGWIGGKHIYFYDACRTTLIGDPSPLGMQMENGTKGPADLYNLYSTVEGTVAPVDSGFGSTLLEGLHGAPGATEGSEGARYVTLQGLKEFLKSKLNRRIEAYSAGPLNIVRVPPAKKITIEIEATTALPHDQFRVVLNHAALNKAKTIKFTGPAHRFTVPPKDWSVRLFNGSQEWPRLEPARLDLTASARVVFSRPRRDADLGKLPPRLIVESAGELTSGPLPIAWDLLRTLGCDFGNQIFKDLPLAEAEVRVLLADEVSDDVAQAALHNGLDAAWVPSLPLDQIDRFQFPAEAGSKIVSIAFTEGLSISLATFAAKNWITLILVRRAVDHSLTIAQVLARKSDWPSTYLRMSVDLQQSMRTMTQPETIEAIDEPVLRLFAERFRRSIGARPSPLHTYPLSFPDLIAFRRRLGETDVRPAGIPLLLENLLAVPGWEDRLPLPSRRIEFASTWTCWTGAI